MAARRNTEVRLYSGLPVTNATPYKTLLRKQIVSAKGRTTRKAGYADAEIVLNGKRRLYPGLKQGACMEVYARDRDGQMQRLYRGYVVNVVGDTKGGRNREAAQTTISLLGIWDQRSRTVIRQRYAFPDGADNGAIFSRIATKWIGRYYPYLVVQNSTVGQSLFAIDAWRKTFGSIAEEIVDSAGGFAVCGGDVNLLSGADQLYMRPFDDPAAAVTVILPDPRNRVSRYEAEEDATGLANGIDLKGGKLRFPNLLAEVTGGNTSFEYPTRTNEDTYGELVFDGGFESDNFPPGTPHASSAITGITVVSGNTHIITGNVADFTKTDAGRSITITSGAGLTVGSYKINSVYRADPFSALGNRYIAILNKPVGPVGAGPGTGVLADVDAWNTTGAAILRQGGGAYGAADSGNFMLHLVNQGDSVYKPFGPDAVVQAGKKFRFRTRLRLENGGGAGNVALLTVRWYDNSGSQVGSDVVQGFALTTAAGYDTYDLDTVCPVGAVKGRAYVKFEVKPSGGVGGILVDNISVTSATDVVQPGWDFYPTGTATVQESDWAWEGTSAFGPVHGAYAVRVKVASSDVDNNDVSFRPRDNPLIGVNVGQTIVSNIWVGKVPTAATRPKIQGQIFCFDENGNFIDSEKVLVNFAATSDAGWKQLLITKTIPANTRSIKISWVIRGNGEVLFDAAEIRDGATGLVAATTPVGYPFVEGDTYERILRATDIFASGTDAYKSAETWGEITDLVDEDSITVDEDATRYGTVRLTRTATPNQRPQIETVGPYYPFFPGRYIRAIGRDADEILPEPLPILEVQWEITARGVLKMRPSINDEEVDEMRVTRDIVRRELTNGGSGNSSTGSSSGGASSLTLGGGGTTTPATVADASATTKGATKLSVAPAVATEPIAVGANDPVLVPFRLIARYTTATVPSSALTLTKSGRIELECSGGNITLLLPDPNTIPLLDGLVITIVKDDGATVLPGTTVTIKCSGTGTVGKLAQLVLNDDQDMVMLIVSAAQNNYLRGGFVS